LINLKKLQLLIPWELGDYNIQTSKFFYFWVFFSVNFFTPKLMKIRWSLLFIGSFAPHFQIKLSIHASNFNSIFVSMSELELFLLTGGLDSKLQHYGPYKNSRKNSKTSHSNRSGHIEGDVMQNHEKKKKGGKSEKPRFYGQNKQFFEHPTL
jgi:hypothetical protein